VRAELEAVLDEARRRGFVGGSSSIPHLRHAEVFVVSIERLGGVGSGLDLGSGGGLPGLVLADRWPESRWYLLDASQRRVGFLADAVARLGWSGRVDVLHGRAEVLARRPDLRGHIDVVTARAFGPPAVTAECAAGFLRQGGHLLVSEPPEEPSPRWPVAGLAELGLVTAEEGTVGGGEAHLQAIRQAELCPDRYPRRDGMPAKRPLF
jgi:16S rRNA (guanine527-N7)-methyltransferase